MSKVALNWFPSQPDWKARFRSAKQAAAPFEEWVALANAPLDFIKTEMLDTAFRQAHPEPPSQGLLAPPIRLALLGSSTTKHLHSGLRVASLRRGFYADIYEPEYGQYWFELLDAGSSLHAFKPTAFLFAFDARHMMRGADPTASAAAAEVAVENAMAHVQACWQKARTSSGEMLLQQTVLPVFPHLAGQNEHVLPASPAVVVGRLNAALRVLAVAEGVDLVAVDDRAAQDGVDAWYSEAFWHQAKQEVALGVSPLYGDMVLRVLGARFGRSAKCLVLDLDNTLWGGVVGDDGVEGLVLGQGNAEGEAFSAFQSYARDLSRRGVILAVCSKNDVVNALAPFERHPEMVLRRDDIACFIANWDDKPTNLRRISETLSIGLDAMVFVDDNPFERNLVREKLPMVMVPEVGDDPSTFARRIADAGYFEAVTLTKEDLARGAQYQANLARAAVRESGAATANDIGEYLAALEMRLIWNRFDAIGRPRIAQLINKSNQFNLTTRRYSEEDIMNMTSDPECLGIQLRLTDKFGDNGMIAVVIMFRQGDVAIIDSWLMSCRVLGRKVEEATLRVLATEAQQWDVSILRGVYIPSPKNSLVRDHYRKLGFDQVQEDSPGEWYELELDKYKAPLLPIVIAVAEPLI